MLHTRQDFIQHNEFFYQKFTWLEWIPIMCIITEISLTMTNWLKLALILNYNAKAEQASNYVPY